MATKKSTKKNAKTSKAHSNKSSPARSTAKKLSALDAAARVLQETKQALSCPELVDSMAAKGYWTSPAGKTPAATLYAAIQREIVTKKEQSRFQKSAPGRFALA
jgi:hypothetical protein